jgi:OmpA-OmpF porin, OOP family
MKSISLLLAGAAMAVTAPALAREGQAYIGINGGVILEDQVDVDLVDTDPRINAAFADTKTGVDADVVLGYDFGAFRLEAEGGYKQAGYDGLTVLSTVILPDGVVVPPGTVVQNEEDLKIWSGMVNALVEFGSDDGLQIYGGGGVGVANIDLPVRVAGVGTVIEGNETEFAWQLIAGARLALSDNVDLGVKYRYFVADNFQFEAANGSTLESDFDSHSILASLTYNFGSRAEPAPVVAPPPPAPVTPPPPPPVVTAPPPPPRPVCNSGPFIVFFDFDRSDITPEAAQILNNAATAYSNCGNARVCWLVTPTPRAARDITKALPNAVMVQCTTI